MQIGLQYGNIHDVPAPSNILNLPAGILNVWLQPSVFNALIVIGFFLAFVWVVHIWLTHR